MKENLLSKDWKFVIVSPRQKYGGAIVLHTLCKILDNEGYDAKIFYNEVYKKNKIYNYLRLIFFYLKDTILCMTAPFLGKFFKKTYKGYINLSVKGVKRKILPIVDKKTIVVYPEGGKWNILNSKNVVRFLLYYHDLKDDEYSKNDLFIAYRDEFNDLQLNPDNYLVKCPYYDLDLYKQTNYKDRNGTCFIIRKGKNRDDLPDKFEGIIIDDLSEKEIVKVFNSCKYCVSYDTQTAYSSIAAICGCISIVIPEKGKDAKYYRKDGPKYGIAYGNTDDEIEYAKKTQKLVLDKYIESNKNSKQNVYNFLKICKYKFENI